MQRQISLPVMVVVYCSVITKIKGTSKLHEKGTRRVGAALKINV
ncbi:MAG: hypothetical protein ACEY3D_09430 [Rickettsia sp.]